MNYEDEENKLRDLPLRAPSHHLDTRMEQLFVAHTAERPRFLWRPLPIWQCAVICLLCALVTFLVGRWGHGTVYKDPGRTTEVRYVIQRDEQGFDVFDWTKYPKKSAPSSILRAKSASYDSAGKS